MGFSMKYSIQRARGTPMTSWKPGYCNRSHQALAHRQGASLLVASKSCFYLGLLGRQDHPYFCVNKLGAGQHLIFSVFFHVCFYPNLLRSSSLFWRMKDVETWKEMHLRNWQNYDKLDMVEFLIPFCYIGMNHHLWSGWQWGCHDLLRNVWCPYDDMGINLVHCLWKMRTSSSYSYSHEWFPENWWTHGPGKFTNHDSSKSSKSWMNDDSVVKQRRWRLGIPNFKNPPDESIKPLGL